MTINQIHDRLLPLVRADHSLLLEPHLFPSLAKIMTFLQLDRLVLQGVNEGAIELQPHTLTIKANASLLNIDTNITLIVISDTPEPLTVLSIDVPNHWHLQDSFGQLPQGFRPLDGSNQLSALSDSLLEALELSEVNLMVYSSAKENRLAGISIEAKTTFPSELAQLQQLLQFDDQLQLSGHINLREDKFPLITLSSTTTDNPLTIQALTINQPALEFVTLDGGPVEEGLTQTRVKGQLSIGDTDPIVLDIKSVYQTDGLDFNFNAQIEGGLSITRGLDALLEFSGAQVTDLTLPGPLSIADSLVLDQISCQFNTEQGKIQTLGFTIRNDQQWSLLPDLVAIRDLSIVWQLDYPFESAERRHSATSFTATLAFGTEQPLLFSVSAEQDNGFQLHGAMQEGTRVNLGQLVQKALALDTDLPNIYLQNLTFDGQSNGDLQLQGELDGNWSLPVAHNSIELTQLLIDIQRTSEAQQATLYGQLEIAGIPLYVNGRLQHTDAGTLIDFNGGSVNNGRSIKLTSLANAIVEQFGGELPLQTPDIEIHNLQIGFNNQAQKFSFAAETNSEISIPFLTSDHAQVHAQVNLVSQLNPDSGKRQLSGFMEADMNLGGEVFTLQYTMGSDKHLFEASWEQQSDGAALSINALFSAMGIDQSISIPARIEPQLSKIYLAYQTERKTLQLIADSTSGGEIFVIVSKLPLGKPTPGQSTDTSQWQYVFGWDYQDQSSLKDLPGFGNRFDPAQGLHFNSLGVIISSTAIKQFEMPLLPGLKTLIKGTAPSSDASEARATIGQGKVVKLEPGLAILAELDLSQTDQSGSIEALRTVVTDTTLTVMAAIDFDNTEFTISAQLDGSVSIPTGGSSNLQLADAQLNFIFADIPVVQLKGDVNLHFDHHSYEVTPALSISAEEIEFSAAIDFGDGLEHPMGIKGLTLDQGAFEMGVNLLPAPGVNLGLQGNSHIDNQAPNSDNFTFVMEIVEEIPDPLLLSFYLAEIDISTALAVFVPDVAHDVPAIVNDINMTDVNFYWAESVVVIPDGTVAQPGLRFSGNLELLGFKAHAALAIQQGSGISGEFETSPIHIGNILSLTGAGKGVYLNQKDGKTLPVTITPDSEQTGIVKTEVVPPGGPVIIFNTQHSPYLQMGIKVTFLELLSEQIQAQVSDSGIRFRLAYDIASLVTADIDFVLNRQGFDAHSHFGIHLKADLGPIKILGIDFGTIHLDTGFDISMAISVHEDEVSFILNGEFEFEGARLSFPQIHLDFAPASLAKLPELIIQQIIDHMEDIFADLFASAEQLLSEGLHEAAELAENAAHEVAHLATEAEQEAEQIVTAAADAIAHDVAQAAQAAQQIEHQAEQILTDAATEVAHIGEQAVAEVEQIGHQIADIASSAEHEVAAIASEVAEEASEVAHAVERLGEEAEQEVKAIGQAIAHEASQIINAAQQVASSIVADAKKVANALAKEAKALLDEAKRLADAIAHAASAVGHAVSHAAKSAWHAVSKY